LLEKCDNASVGSVEDPRKVGINYIGPILLTHHHERLVLGYPRIIDEDIESAEFLFHFLYERFGAFKIPYVKLNRQRFSTEMVDLFSQ
jgi:hypothetical protein